MSQLLLALDETALPVRAQVCLHLSRPQVRAEPVLIPAPLGSNQPDDVAAMFYGSVLYDGGRYRMWYHACHSQRNPDWSADQQRQLARYRDPVWLGPVCYAESDDGINWRRPALGQFRWQGSTAHNALDLPHTLTAGALVLKDEQEPDPGRRYKMIYQFFPRYADPRDPRDGGTTTVATAVSPDGLSWRLAGVPYLDQFMEPAGFWQHQGRYVFGYQAGDGWGAHFSNNGHASGRQGLARMALDFDHWIDGYLPSFLVPEPQDPARRGHKGSYVHNHLGVAAASFGNVCVGLYGIWYNEPNFADIHCDLGLLVSRDGVRFTEPAPGQIFLAAADSPAEPCATGQAFHTNLCQGNGILNVGDETRIYHGRWRNSASYDPQVYYGSIALATLPRDRWGALAVFPNRQAGHVWTQPVTLGASAEKDTAITLNATDARGLSVSLCDENFQPLTPAAGGAGGNNLPIVGDAGLDLPVLLDGELLSRLRGRAVRLRIGFRKTENLDPRLYAVNVRG